jgi:predicted Co/Zn/Cd cation transporter (cation efflux family)
MINPFSMFTEKQGAGTPLSMTRVVAFVFAITYCIALTTYAQKAFAINWPFAALGIITLLAVPLQSIFTYLREYIASTPGRALLAQAIEHFVPGPIGTTVASTVERTSSRITTTDTAPKDAG